MLTLGPERGRKAGAPKRTRVLLIGICLLAGIICLSLGAETTVDVIQDAREDADTQHITQVRDTQLAIAEASAAISTFIRTGDPIFLTGFLHAERRLAASGGAVLTAVEAADPLARRSAGVEPSAPQLAVLEQEWKIAADLVQHGQPEAATTALRNAHAEEHAVAIGAELGAHLTRFEAAETAHASVTGAWYLGLRIVTISAFLLSLILKLLAARQVGAAITEGEEAGRTMQQLFIMTDMLQSAADAADTNAVLRSAAWQLLPEVDGALYVFNNSRDRLDLATTWGDHPADHADHLAPASCWALKRGKPHLNGVEAGALRCGHCSEGRLTLDIPMAARGQLNGLLEIAATGPHALRRLDAARPMATAIADALSLSLSNAALRTQLRNQALRDELTGLYNRRFLEEVLERLCLEAERRGSSIGLVMLDLDNFKRLNDTHGHAMGDAVLREVGAAILASIGPTDIACRYGGEELLVLLPDCGLDLAAGKAEQLRSRIADLAFAGGVTVTGSFGVAALPETSVNAQGLLVAADSALYQAKTAGRDRVVSAPLRHPRSPETPVLTLAR